MSGVWAVVVTHDRRALLETCVAALRAQSHHLARIAVIDNDSADDTAAWLDRQGDLLAIRQRNLGSAGGQDRGIRAALDGGADWIWCLDDDGRPAPDCLAALLAAAEAQALDLVAPLVVSESEPSRLAFGLGPAISTVAEAMARAEHGLIRDLASPFNGLLLRAAAARRIGPVKREMFIWGDEVEYLWRAQSRGLVAATCVGADFVHPPDRLPQIPVLGGLAGRLPWPVQRARRRIYVRNRAFLYRRYGRLAELVKLAIKLGLHLGATGRWGELAELVAYAVDGARDRYRLAPSRGSLQQRGPD